MASFKDHVSNERTKMLVTGDSKSGKTSLIATLANAGYNVRVLDFDDGLDSVAQHLSGDEAAERIHYITLKDEPKSIDAWRTAWNKIIQVGWKTDTEDLGNIREWASDTVLFVDSLTFAGKAALHNALAINGRKPYSDNPTQPEWGQAIRDVEGFLDFIMSDRVKCNVVMTALPIAVDDDSGVSKVYPQAVTKNFSAQVPRFFNNVVGLRSKRDGSRILRLQGDSRQEFGVTKKLGAEYEADLGKLFKELQKDK